MLVLARRQDESLIIGDDILDADYDLTTFGEKEGFWVHQSCRKSL